MGVRKGYKQTEVGVIPEDWVVADLSRLCYLQRGFDITRATRIPGDVPVYSSSGISYYHNKAAASPPALVTGRKGILGKVFLVQEPFWPHDTTLFATDFRNNVPSYVAVVLASFGLERLDAATSVPTLNRNNLAGIPIPIPPTKAEQQAIATALSDADALIESLEQLIAKKRLIKQGTMQELLTGKRRVKGFEGEWKSIALGELGIFLNGRGISRSESGSGKIPCIRYGELYTKHTDVVRAYYSHISSAIASRATLLKCGDLLFAGSGETKSEIGKCAAFVENLQAYAGGDIVILRQQTQDPTFLGYYLNTPRIVLQKASRGQGDAVVHISSKALSNIELFLPKLLEQTAIATILSDMDAEIEALEGKLAKARQLKTGMMHNLLTGKIRLV